MRLICPNCDAQYEVPSEVIPEDGRDVQCSNCGDTWFQSHVSEGPSGATEDETAVPVAPAEPEIETAAHQDLEETTELGAEEPEEAAPEPAEPAIEQTPAEPVFEQTSGDLDEEYEEDEPASIGPEPVARELDPAVVEVLRQEAEHEAQQRLNEQTAGLEIQPDLGLQEAEDDAGRRAREARERMPKPKDDVPVGTDSAIAQALASRRNLLPDVEEINSSLNSSSGQVAGGSGDVDEYLEPPTKKRSFGSGFTMIVLLAVILGAVYIMAPKITQTVPAAGPAVTAYVAIVDKGRAALGDRVKGILDWLDAKASSSNP